MFIFNVKLNGNKLFKISFTIFFIIALILLCIAIYKIIFQNKNVTIGDEMNSMPSAELSASNYTNTLKAVHDNLDTYIGQEINFSGYVYRVYDLQHNQFILARDMIINSNFQTLVVGFLCECNNANELSDNTWVHITGTISKGNYHGDIPILKITKIQKIEKPTDEYVYPPDDSYVPTDTI